VGDKHQNVIEINGKKYDAVTGRPVEAKKEAVKPVHQTPLQPAKKTGVALDGFVRRAAPAQPKQITQTVDKPHAAVTAQHHKKKVQKSQTLMRQAVKKPQQVSSPQKQTAPTQPSITKATLQPSKERVQKATTVQKSKLVHRFGSHAYKSSVIKKVEPLEVKKPATLVHSQAPPIVTPSHQMNSRRTSEQLIDSALASATSHEQPEHKVFKKKRTTLSRRFGISPKLAGISTFVLAGALLMGFYTIQHVPNLAMRVASSQAGFQASMPGYQPAGFSFQGPIQHQPGEVSISFRSNTDERSYTLTQRESNWNSDALLSEYVVAGNKQYQTYLDRGRTLYIYDGSNATWVDNGVWYQIEGESAMTTDQLVRIASSL
jgi:hypothetical protein